jgi:UDP-N-acetylglucosamine 2-epimerase (non-hydrolysing)
MKRILVVFGTRPEAIKLAPVIDELKMHPDIFDTYVCVTAQHRQMLDQVLEIFKIVPDYDLDIMSPNQDLFDITERILNRFKKVLKIVKPDILMVHGDTTTTFVASLAAFYQKIPIAHIEAGLRTYDKYQPFPEEINRQLTSVFTDYHFSPTKLAKDYLIKENVHKDKIWITGNTSIDALLSVVKSQKEKNLEKTLRDYFLHQWNLHLQDNSSKIILVTGHRRENFGKGFVDICNALKDIAENNPDVKVVYPVHLNPNVKKPVYEILGSDSQIPSGTNRNIYLIEPLQYEYFVYLMSKAYIILTDSGGIQEEAPSLSKPVLVMRETTERPEGVTAGCAILVGTDSSKIILETQRLIDDDKKYIEMVTKENPYGDGLAASKIVESLRIGLGAIHE